METLQDLKIRQDCAKGAGQKADCGNAIFSRGRSQEEAYFARENARLVRELKEKEKKANRK